MNNKSKIDLAIVTRESFPIGMAATNRILSYAKEIAKHRTVKVLITQPTELPGFVNNTAPAGSYKNISFEYVHNMTQWPKESPKIYKAYLILKGFFLLFKNLNNNCPNTVLLVSNDIKLIWGLWIYSKLLRFKYYQEKSEKPSFVKKRTNSLYSFFYLFSYTLFDGIIVMTKELGEYFSSIGQKNVFHLPMTVDLERFGQPKDEYEKLDKTIFMYCGGGTYERDGLLNMVEAFIDLKKDHEEFEFQIIGPINDASEYFKNVVTIIEHYHATNIKFLGMKSSHEIPGLLAKADCLIMTPPKDFDSGGFPTKLGEYLATGIPVICTKVSEIPNYLDDFTAILIEPNNHRALIEALKKVISNYDACKEIGNNGKKIAQKHFSAQAHTESLIQFFKLGNT